MSDLSRTLLLMVPLGFVAGLTSWGIVGALAYIRRGYAAEASFAGGMTAARMVQGAVGGGAIAATTSGLLARWDPAPTTFVVIMIAGVVTVLAGVRVDRRPSAAPEFTVRPAPVASAAVQKPALYRVALTPVGLTLISPRQWLLTAVAVSAIAGLSPRTTERVAVFAVYLVAAAWFPLTLLAVRIVRPRQAMNLITRAEDWMQANGRRVLRSAIVVVGCGLVALGAAGLWA